MLLTRRALRQLETILAIEVLLAAGTLDSQPALPRLGAGTRAAYDTVRSTLDRVGRAASAAAIAEAARRALVAGD